MYSTQVVAQHNSQIAYWLLRQTKLVLCNRALHLCYSGDTVHVLKLKAQFAPVIFLFPSLMHVIPLPVVVSLPYMLILPFSNAICAYENVLHKSYVRQFANMVPLFYRVHFDSKYAWLPHLQLRRHFSVLVSTLYIYKSVQRGTSARMRI